MQTLPTATLGALFAIAAQSLITVCGTVTAMTAFLIGVLCCVWGHPNYIYMGVFSYNSRKDIMISISSQYVLHYFLTG